MNAHYIVMPLEEVQHMVATNHPGAIGKTKRSSGTYGGYTFTYRAGRIRRIVERKTCVCCGKTINHARIVPTASGTHTIDVGHLDEHGTFVRFTVDHLLLDCMGGAYNDTNLQIMCADCNTAKGDLMTMTEIELVRRNPKAYAASGIDITFLQYLLDMQETELRMRAEGRPAKEINRFHIRLASERQHLAAKKPLPPGFVNPYADVLRPPVTTLRTFQDWFGKMPSIKELLSNWLYSHNIFMYC